MKNSKIMQKCMGCGVFRIFNFNVEKPVVIKTIRRKYRGTYKVIQITKLLCPTCKKAHV